MTSWESRLAATLEVLRSSKLLATDRKAGVRRAVELAVLGTEAMCAEAGGLLALHERTLAAGASAGKTAVHDLQVSLISSGNKDLARRVERQARARHVLAHPDLQLPGKVAAALKNAATCSHERPPAEHGELNKDPDVPGAKQEVSQRTGLLQKRPGEHYKIAELGGADEYDGVQGEIGAHEEDMDDGSCKPTEAILAPGPAAPHAVRVDVGGGHSILGHSTPQRCAGV